MPPETPLFPDNRLMGVDSPLPAMPSLTPMPESRGMRPDAFRSGMVTIPLDKLKRMRAAKGTNPQNQFSNIYHLLYNNINAAFICIRSLQIYITF